MPATHANACRSCKQSCAHECPPFTQVGLPTTCVAQLVGPSPGVGNSWSKIRFNLLYAQLKHQVACWRVLDHCFNLKMGRRMHFLTDEFTMCKFTICFPFSSLSLAPFNLGWPSKTTWAKSVNCSYLFICSWMFWMFSFKIASCFSEF